MVPTLPRCLPPLLAPLLPPLLLPLLLFCCCRCCHTAAVATGAVAVVASTVAAAAAAAAYLQSVNGSVGMMIPNICRFVNRCIQGAHVFAMFTDLRTGSATLPILAKSAWFDLQSALSAVRSLSG